MVNFDIGQELLKPNYEEKNVELDENVPLTLNTPVDTESITFAEERDSRQTNTGPGWRSNMKGDYKGLDIIPVSTKDLLSWAFQVVCLLMSNIHKRKAQSTSLSMFR